MLEADLFFDICECNDGEGIGIIISQGDLEPYEVWMDREFAMEVAFEILKLALNKVDTV